MNRVDQRAGPHATTGSTRASQVPKWHKYGAKPTTIDGIRFASKAEARRYSELRLLEKAGEVRELELQPRFPLSVKQCGWGIETMLGTYVADFRYRRGRLGVLMVEDVKGFMTPLAKWKIKHVEAQYGIKVEIIK